MLKWISIVLAGIFGFFVLIVAAVYIISNIRMDKTYNIQVQNVDLPTGEEAIAWGKHISIIRGCADCHKKNFSGGSLIDDPAIGKIYPTNLTSGQGGVIRNYTDIDWIRAIRHGIGPNGNPLLFMPSNEFYFLSDEDLGALIAYLKTVPAVDNHTPKITIGPLGRVLFLAGQFPLISAENIDHDGPRSIAPKRGITVEYGEYIAVSCFGCHGSGLSGGSIPGVPPDWPSASNLTPSGDIANWTKEEFIETMRNGITPSGHQFDSKYMPWRTFGQMTDEELQALWLYLQALPAKATGNR